MSRNYNELPGVINCENRSLDEIYDHVSKLESQMGINPNDYLKQFCPLSEYINCVPEDAFLYLSKTENLAEWTMSLRNFSKFRDDIYISDDILEPDTRIFTRTIINKETGCVDYLCAWDQPEELWMRYYFRVLDAKPTLGIPGTVVTWFNCKHRYYEKTGENIPTSISDGMWRTDRHWVGDLWPMFYFGHHIEITNLKYILESKPANIKSF